MHIDTCSHTEYMFGFLCSTAGSGLGLSVTVVDNKSRAHGRRAVLFPTRIMNGDSQSITDRWRLFRGMETNLKTSEQSNVVRVFVSSTFSDMSVERNILLEKAYPTLRTFCQKLGLDFQVMDMRWGVQDSATVDHSTCELCLMEIKNCKRLSMGPHFVAFLGNRYGYRPIPSNIELKVFETITRIAKELKCDETGALSQWYKRDDNAVPLNYVLQPITSLYPHFDQQDLTHKKQREADRDGWAKTSAKLTDILRQCAQTALYREEIDENEGKIFFQSVTELEIEEGLASTEGFQSAYLYRREIKDLQQHMSEKSIGKYLDINESGNIDSDAQSLLNQLKNEIGKKTGLEANVKSYEVEWSSREGINPRLKTHLNYLQTFCDDFVSDLQRSIEATTAKFRVEVESDEAAGKETNDWLYEEILHQAVFAQGKCETFCGRQKLLETIMSTMEHARHPAVVYGKSGRGKTALCAKLSQLCREKSTDDVIVYRFLGTSPNSSHILNVLQTLILQITEVFELPIPGIRQLQNFNSVVQMFSKLLETISEKLSATSEKGRLVMFLDSLDQLSTQEGAHRVNWLPKQLPPKVTVLLTTLPDSGLEVMTSLRRSLPSKNFVEVPVLDDATGQEILNTWLVQKKRTLNAQQHQLVMDAFKVDPSPLFLKLAFEEACRWHSYTDMSEVRFADTARGAITNFFQRLETRHGEFFVSRAFGYLIAAKNGITESELEDLLSLDDEVLDSSYRYWSPPIRNVVRVPPLLWTRLRYDLGGDLVERQAVGHTVLAFYHRQYIEVARERYLSESVRMKIHRQMAKYFIGTWSGGRKKELSLNIWNKKSRRVDRQVASQPLKFADKVFNLRKLDELPFHLVRASMWQQLNDVVLSSATWMSTKIAAFAIKDVLDDYNMALEAKYDPEVLLIRDALKLAKPTLEFGGGITNHLCVELYGRLAYFKDEFPKVIGKLLKESEEIICQQPTPILLPTFGCFQPPGGPLRTTLTGFSKPVTCLVRGGKEPPLIAAGSMDGLIMIWEVGADEVVHTIRVHSDRVACLAIEGLRLASGSYDDTLLVMNLDTGSRVALIQEDHNGYDAHASIALRADGTFLASACGKEVNVWDIASSQRTFTLISEACLSTNVIFLDSTSVVAGCAGGRVMRCFFETGDENQLYAASFEKNESQSNQVIINRLCGKQLVSIWADGNVGVWNAETNSQISSCGFKMEETICISNDGSLFAVGQKNKVAVWKINEKNPQCLGILRHHRDVITSLIFDEKGQTLIVGSQDEEITAWSVDQIGTAKNPCSVMKGMGARVDRLVVLDNIVVSASLNVFYLKLWNLQRKKIVAEPPTFPLELGKNSVSQCGRYLAYVDRVNAEIKVHDLRSKQFEKMIAIPLDNTEENDDASTVVQLKFSNDSRCLVYGTSEGLLYKIENPILSKETQSAHKIEQHRSPRCLTFFSLSNDDQNLLLSSRDAQVERDWLSLLSGATLEKEVELSLDKFGIDGQITAICVSNSIMGNTTAFVGTDTCLICVIRMTSSSEDSIGWKNMLHSTLSSHGNPLSYLALNYNQNVLFSGSKGQTRRLWKLDNDTWKLHHEIKFNSLLDTGVTCAAFTSDDAYVITGSHERSLKVWKVETGEMVAAQYVYASVTGLTVTDDERVVVATKMGYLIIDQFLRSNKIPSTAYSNNNGTKRLRLSSSKLTRRHLRSATSAKRSTVKSTACSIL